VAATAAAVSRILANARIQRNRWVASHRIRGWGHSTGGFQAETITEYDQQAGASVVTGIRVKWILGDWSVGDVHSEAVARANAEVARAIEVLTEKGYKVEKRTHETTGLDFLHVTKD
jgi:hypothetical protein